MSDIEATRTSEVRRFWGGFKNETDIKDQYDLKFHELDSCEILFAYYSIGGYDGFSTVLFKKGYGQLFLDTSGHCSCNGLEGSWAPKKVTWAYMKEMYGDPSAQSYIDSNEGSIEAEAFKALAEIIETESIKANG